jgi:hypothetical protein
LAAAIAGFADPVSANAEVASTAAAEAARINIVPRIRNALLE